MSFELEIPTPAKLTDIVVLSQKNRQPDDLPGAKLSVEMALSSDMLAHFDGTLKSFLFTKDGQAQSSLEGIESLGLTKAGRALPQLHWELELTGYGLTLDMGLGGKSNLVIGDCILSNFRLLPKEGGTLLARFDIESGDVTEKAFGKLATLKSREISLLLEAPEVGQKKLDDVDETVGWPFPTGSKEQADDARFRDANGGAPPAHLREGMTKAEQKTERAAAKKTMKTAPAKTKAPMKYRDAATGETWSGRGVMPKWLKVGLERTGKTLSDYEVAKAH